MKKKLFKRILFGFPIGVFISCTISILISLRYSNGYYSPVEPTLISSYGSEITAVTVQYILSGILGSIMGASSLVWDIENLSLLKQTIINFVVSSCSILPIAYAAHWMYPSFLGALAYFAMFAFIYFAIWLVQYLIWKKKINQINTKIKG